MPVWSRSSGLRGRSTRTLSNRWQARPISAAAYKWPLWPWIEVRHDVGVSIALGMDGQHSLAMLTASRRAVKAARLVGFGWKSGVAISSLLIKAANSGSVLARLRS
ncbi:MAG: hypothetical protein JWR10_797 [Rubritepida sp.]|nr:hypothetical protein [Rubritepida sp.]